MKISNRSTSVRIFLALFIIFLFKIAILGESNSMSAYAKKESIGRDFKSEANFLSKAQIVKQISELIIEVYSYEKKHGFPTGEGDGKVYSPQETNRLFGFYQSIMLRLHYLETGDIKTGLNQWDRFNLEETGEPYNEEQVMEAVSRLKKLNVPEAFLKDFRIFLLPYSISGISGLGGAGFTMLSPPGSREDLAGSLPVTLYHEIGHHIHLSFMPRETYTGREKWNKYLQIRGGTWHEPGNVNTAEWSNSSEETFAEDFRMLFDKNQPFFGDVSLGDPRSKPQQAKRLKSFIMGLTKEKVVTNYRSPWIPEQNPYLSFWLHQEAIIVSLWTVFGSIYVIMFYGCFSVRRSIFQVY